MMATKPTTTVPMIVFAHGKDGWVGVTIPNEAEMKAYDYEPDKMQGLIIVFFGACDWGRCEPGDMKPEQFDEGLFEVQVNGKNVVNITAVGGQSGGNILKGEDGVNWKPNNDGAYEIKVNVKDPKGYVRWNTIVLY